MKKTLAMLLSFVLVASVCGAMFVSAESTNLALGKDVANAENVGGDVTPFWIDTDLTDGKAETGWNILWTAGQWFGYWWNPDSASAYDWANAPDGVATPTIDLGAVCSIDKVRVNMFLGSDMGIIPAKSVTVKVSTDGENYTDVATTSLTAPEAGDTTVGWVEFALETPVDAQYVCVEMVLGAVWLFVDEIEVYGTAPASEGGDDPAPEAPAETTLSVTHVNLYSWNAYRCQIITGEGNSCASYAHTAFDATEYVVLKVENVDGAYTVTAIEGAGVAKTLAAPADGFLLYCGNKDPDNFAIVGNVKVGDVVLANTVDLATDAASETVIGTITFGSAVEEDGPGDAGVLVFAVLAVVAIAGCAVATKIKSSAL
ncbi:MAG: discoidin domain-containing protein [Clostridia bacterium]|nr:discoidin domain-containing protein [Clostridia bacterium]